MTDPVPLTAEEAWAVIDKYKPSVMPDAPTYLEWLRARTFLDRDRSTPSVDGLREALAVYDDPVIAMNTSAATMARAVRAFLADRSTPSVDGLRATFEEYVYPSDYCGEPTHKALSANSVQSLDALLIAAAPLLRDGYVAYVVRRAQAEVEAAAARLAATPTPAPEPRD